MSTRRRSVFPGTSKKISSCVRPGVCEVRASALRPVSALIRLDLPTLERPAKAISSPAIGGSVSIEGEAQMNCQSRGNSFRPVSISFASLSSVMRSSLFHRHSGAMRSIEPGISRFRVWCFAPSRNDEVEVLRLRRLLRERRLEIVEQLHLHAVAAHDEALLEHRER